jgi:hypothetical protein
VYARSTTYLAKPELIDAGLAEVRDNLMPAIGWLDGFVGLSMLVDRWSGRCITTSAWRSEEARRSADEALRPMLERVGEVLGDSPQVDEWEIAVLHRERRSGDGSCVRVTWMQVEPAELDRAIDVYRMVSLPRAEELDGFCSASLLVERSSGRAVSSVTYDGVAAMESNREAAAALRTADSSRAGAELLDAGEFELALAHLRVPELI